MATDDADRDPERLAPPEGTADPDSDATATSHDAVDLPVVPPSVPRAEAASEGEGEGRVGAVAYPYRVFEVAATVDRRFFPSREVEFVASVDLARRLVLRADAAPDPQVRRVEDALVIPATLSADAARDRATETVHEWTRRRFALGSPPDVSVTRAVAAYKLFWLASRPDGDVLVDSVRGTETPYDE